MYPPNSVTNQMTGLACFSRMIRGCLLLGDSVLVWSPQGEKNWFKLIQTVHCSDAISLRRDHRITGSLVGGLPTSPRQRDYMGLPLELLPEETSLLLQKGSSCLCTDHLIVSRLGLIYISTCNEPHPSNETKVIGCTDAVDHANTDTDTDHVNWNWPSTDEEVTQCRFIMYNFNVCHVQVLRYRVYSDLWQKGYYITSGLKYGGEYLVYKGMTRLIYYYYYYYCCCCCCCCCC